MYNVSEGGTAGRPKQIQGHRRVNRADPGRREVDYEEPACKTKLTNSFHWRRITQ
jgi:hypothetical protein